MKDTIPEEHSLLQPKFAQDLARVGRWLSVTKTETATKRELGAFSKNWRSRLRCE